MLRQESSKNEITASVSIEVKIIFAYVSLIAILHNDLILEAYERLQLDFEIKQAIIIMINESCLTFSFYDLRY